MAYIHTYIQVLGLTATIHTHTHMYTYTQHAHPYKHTCIQNQTKNERKRAQNFRMNLTLRHIYTYTHQKKNSLHTHTFTAPRCLCSISHRHEHEKYLLHREAYNGIQERMHISWLSLMLCGLLCELSLNLWDRFHAHTHMLCCSGVLRYDLIYTTETNKQTIATHARDRDQRPIAHPRIQSHAQAGQKNAKKQIKNALAPGFCVFFLQIRNTRLRYAKNARGSTVLNVTICFHDAFAAGSF
jgi:hypothetical protein